MANVTPIGRMSFPELFKPKAFESEEPKYSVVLLFDANDPQLAAMKMIASAAAKEKWGDNIPKSLRSPFRNGDEKPDLDGYAGKVFVRFSSKTKPAVVDARTQPITEESQRLYAGCFGRVSYTVYAYDQKGNKGVSFGLVNVQKTSDGEPFSGRTNPDDDFDEVETADSLAGDEAMFA